MKDSLDGVPDHDSAVTATVQTFGLHTISTTATVGEGKAAKIRMLEFFSGIGGMRISLEKALGLLNNETNKQEEQKTYVLESCRAYDISLHANNVYHYNFCSNSQSNSKKSKNKNCHSVCTKLVEQLKPEDIAPLQANLWTMSPPCQPFTTNGEGRGKQRLDASDKRCNGLKGIVKLLEALDANDKPKWILLENVKGFKDSAMCEIWCDCLRNNGYSHQSFVLSPVEFGIPNHRTRYYLLAELDSKRWFHEEMNSKEKSAVYCSSSISNGDATDIQTEEEKRRTPFVHGITSLSASDEITKRPIHKVGRYIDDHQEQYSLLERNKDSHENHFASTLLDPHLVPRKILLKAWSKGLGIVSKNDKATHCFTAGYGRIYHRSTGSLLLIEGSKADIERNGAALEALPLDRSDMAIYEHQLRRFKPEELLRLFGFVDVDAGVDNNSNSNSSGNANDNRDSRERKNVFEIPSSVVPSLEQRYKLIGNSINVDVVTELLRELLLSA